MPPRAWNVIHVKRSDENVFEALACDSFSLKVGICLAFAIWQLSAAIIPFLHFAPPVRPIGVHLRQ